MIASLRGLIVLVVIAVGLALALLLGSPVSSVADRTLVPGFTPETVSSLDLSYAGKPAVKVIRAPETSNAGKWNLEGAPAIELDTATVDAVLAALRGATWHRRADRDVASPTRGELRVSHATGSYRVVIGREVTGSAQTWLVVGDRALLVDSWVAHALLPAPLALRVRQPLAGAAAADAMHGPGVTFERRFQATPVQRWIPEAAFAEIVSALVDLTIVSLDGMHPAARGHVISIYPTVSYAIEMAEAGTCDGERIRVETNRYGAGCVERAAWQRALVAFEPFVRTTNDPSIVDTRIVPFALTGLKVMPNTSSIADQTELALVGRPRLGGDETVDLDRVNELLAALATPGTIVPRPTTAPRMYFDAAGLERIGTRLTIFDGVIARMDEQFGLRPPPEAFAVITRPVVTLVDPVLWREDVTTLTSVTLDGATYQRGAVIGEWTRTPAGKVDAALVDSLVETLARVRGPPGAAPTKVAHTVTVTITPPTGQPVTHTLELGLPTAEGCAARVDRKPVRLPLPLCTAVVALAARR